MGVTDLLMLCVWSRVVLPAALLLWLMGEACAQSNITVGSATVTLTSVDMPAGSNDFGTITLNGNATLVLNGAVDSTNVFAGTVFNNSSNSLVITNSGLVMLSTSDITLGSALGARDNLLYVGGTGSVINLRGQRVVVGKSSAHTNNGMVVDSGAVVTNGYVVIGNNGGGAPGSSVGNYLVVTNGGRYFPNNSIDVGTISGSVSNMVYVGGSGALINLGGLTMKLGYNSGATNSYATIATGGVLANGTVTMNGVGSMFFFDGGTMVAGGNVNLFSGSSATVTLQNAGAFIDSAGFSPTVSVSVVADAGSSGGLTKVGAGMLTLSGTNTYAGVTAVSNGTLTLAASGSISNSSVINAGAAGVLDVSAVAGGFVVASNQVLCGNGVVTGSVILAAGGGIGGGETNAVGTLTVTNDLAMSEGSVVCWDYSGATGDVVQVGGVLTLPTNATVRMTGVKPPPACGVLFRYGSLAGATISAWKVEGASMNSRVVVDDASKSVLLLSPSGTVMIIK